ncbi:thioredoxin family protein [Anaerotalea alkaliphila]|uniref:Thioredoxin family protein n=1 Tax=Anaerotalea alkaliphila TaxID=2662126 RepID=A0A7X5HW37_9FIRM|nr:thioredoxin family protein [Anaerotalea alkaliphila]NDL67526.1 thioredoxin family protein [Anaerotalea alkaliphila]
MNRIVIIGTQPACPRCRLLTAVVSEKVKDMELDAEVRHMAYSSEEAVAIAKKAGLTPGTAKDVARILDRKVDLHDKEAERDLETLDLTGLEPHLQPLAQLMREVWILDHRLRFFENKAQEAGILMTPVLVVNGKILHQGSMPGLDKIGAWLSELL